MSQLDFTVGLGKESTYGTPATVSRFPEAPAKMKYDIETVQGEALRATRRVARASRNTVARYKVAGDMEVEATTKGLGYLLNAALGAVTNTVIPASSPSLYQQVHTLRTDDPVDSYTIQERLPFLGGALQPHTFTGCVVDSLELSVAEGGVVKVKLGWLGRDMMTDQPGEVASYPVGDELLTYVHGWIKTGGTLTVPTNTVPSSMTGDAAVNISAVTINVSNGLDTNGYNLGGVGRRTRRNAIGAAKITGKLTVEYTDNALRDAYLAQSTIPLLLTFLHQADIGGVGMRAMLQVALPAIRLKGEVPASNGGKPIELSIDFEAFDTGSQQPIYVVYRTLDVLP